MFCSGRPDTDAGGYSVRHATQEWLAEHLDEWARNRPLLMRSQHDRRPDDGVEPEIYERSIHDRCDIRLVLNDRPRVIRM